VTRHDEDFAGRYAAALELHLQTHDEHSLNAAYELGRSAVREGRGVLDLAGPHHEVLVAALSAATDEAEVRELAATAAVFFCEAVSAFEMVQRVLQEAGATAAVERRQAATVRQLSTFLADASLAADASGSLEEMVQLVAEHAREVLGADRCLARLAVDDGCNTIESMVRSEAEGYGEGAPVPDLEALYEAIAQRGQAVRLAGAELAREPALGALGISSAEDHEAPRCWLAAPLTALDGRRLGLIQLFDKHGGDFTKLDEAVLVQLAQMASAAVERAQLYGTQQGR
jgi:hypothetical protein